MDRRARPALIALGLGLGAGCGARPAIVVPAGAQVVARGSLGYAVAFSPTGLYTIELEERFALVVRDPDSGAARARFELGPAERDLPALAIAVEAGGDVAWLGGADQEVRAIEVGAGATVARWPIGAAVTALAVTPGGWIAVGDATGAICLRRRADGALVQCVVAGTGPITALVVAGPTLVATTGGARLALSLPALGVAPGAPAVDPAAPVVVDRAVVRDGRTLIRFAGPARAVAVGPRGQVAAVGWIRRLDEPSVIVIAADTLPRIH